MIAELIIVSIIPFLVSSISDSEPMQKNFVGLLGIIVAIISGMQKIFCYHENWIQYRTTSELLKKTRILYLSKVPPYDKEDAKKLLVQDVEKILSKEVNNWVDQVKSVASTKA